MRRLLKMLGLAVAAPLALASLAIAWLALAPTRDPESFVARSLPEPVAQNQEAHGGDVCPADRLCRDVTVTLAAEAPIRFTLSLPAERDGRRLPVLVVLGGIMEGRETLRWVPDLGRTAVIAYEYPLDRQRLQKAWLPERLLMGYRTSLAIPRQLAALVRWLRDQDWADSAHVSLVGVSLGALAVPAASRLARANGERLGPAAMIYGGVGLGELAAILMKVEPDWLRGGVAWLIGLAARPIEPASHLPHLEGETLVVNGERDPKMPLHLARTLQDLTPEPKRAVMLDSEHLDPEADPETLNQVLTIATEWLEERGALAR